MSACILWQGALHEGYPMIGTRRAHRLAYEAAHGPIPRGHVVHHSCDTAACVNPEHLEAMTPRAHMLLHRSWEKSHAKLRAQDYCKHGHYRDGVKTVHGVRRRYCRTCHNADLRRRYAVRRLQPFLPQSPQLARAVERDEQPAPLLEDSGPTLIDGTDIEDAIDA